MSRRIRALLATVVAVMLLAVPLRADATSTAPIRNLVTAEAAQPSQRIVDMSVAVRFVHGNELDTGNGALAYSHCDGCESVAVALQVVVMSSDEPVAVQAQNEAVAVNENCTDCRALAAAHQVVLVTPGTAYLSHRGWREVKALRSGLRVMLRSPSPLDVLDAKVAALADELQQTVTDGIVAFHPRGEIGSSRPRVEEREEQTRSDGKGWWHGPRAAAA